MKTLIKTYYTEPQVDSVRILKNVFEKNTRKFSLESLLLSIIAVGVLLMVFFYFLLGLNIEFLSTAISLYSAIGGVVFILMNLIVGILLFILQHGNMLLIAIAIIFGIQV